MSFLLDFWTKKYWLFHQIHLLLCSDLKFFHKGSSGYQVCREYQWGKTDWIPFLRGHSSSHRISHTRGLHLMANSHMWPLIILFITQVDQINAWAAVPASYCLPRHQRETPLQWRKLMKGKPHENGVGKREGEDVQWKNCQSQTPTGKGVHCISYKKWTTQKLSR